MQRYCGLAIGTILLLVLAATTCLRAAEPAETPIRKALDDGWQLQSSWLVKEPDQVVSTVQYSPERWVPTKVPSTVLNALTRSGTYPDLRIGLNAFRIPDSSDEFNQKHDLAKYSHLPEHRNPWKDPCWYRTIFDLPPSVENRHVWLNFHGINYRADVWLNGVRIADRQDVVGSFSRYRFDITGAARPGKNCLAVKIYPVDHPAVPNAQLDVFGAVREYRKEILKDVALVYSVGYDCMPTVADRTIGIWQDVTLEITGPVAIRHPFVVTDLPLPKTDRALLTISAELVNATRATQRGVLEVLISEAGIRLERQVELAPGETREVVFSAQNPPQPILENPRLWWPRNYGPQHRYRMDLTFRIGQEASDRQEVNFGVRKITKELHELNGSHGLRLHVNGQRIFCRGGYLQPEVMHAWDAQRMETEVRYLTEANLNLVYFEDVANPPDAFLDACDRYGLMFGNCFYGCCWMMPGTDYPSDVELLGRSTLDIVRRYRNHPSLVLYMAQNEGDTREDVYRMWRKTVLEHDGTRLFIPSGSFPDNRKDRKDVYVEYRKEVPEWIKPDTPVGMTDEGPKTYGWVSPAQYFRWVRRGGSWMFLMENGSASLPPVDSLRRFIPDLWDVPPGPQFPLTPTWAHHGANTYYRPYDAALRRVHGEPTSVEDYCMKGHLVTADQHRAMFEAVNHRMWDITSGLTQWKLTACWPDVNWQIFDWYLKPMVSYYYIKKACEPLHVQLDLLDHTVTMINHRLQPTSELEISAQVYDFNAKLRWEKTAKATLPANCYRDVLTIPSLPDLTSIWFVELQAKQSNGRVVSDNFYWMASESPDYRPLAALPPAKLVASHETTDEGAEKLVRVHVKNPTDRLAFFVHLALTKGPGGDEVLPVFWDDNYFSLLPGESKTLVARLAATDVGATAPALEMGGWNVESPYECTALKCSRAEAGRGQPVTVTATIQSTFLDGSPIELRVDGAVVETKRLWARGAVPRDVSFSVSLSEPGSHQLTVGDRHATVTVK